MNGSDGKKHKSSKTVKEESGGKKRKNNSDHHHHHHRHSNSNSHQNSSSSSSSSSSSLSATPPKIKEKKKSHHHRQQQPSPNKKRLLPPPPPTPPTLTSVSTPSPKYLSSPSPSSSSFLSSPSSSTISTAYNNNIVNNYKKPKTDPILFGSKVKTRSKVYSGTVRNATYDNVPKLEKLCLQVLMDNYTNITYLGDAPYWLIKPVLEKCSSNQLFLLEDYNPRLTEDDDELWKWHCEKEFRNWKRQEDETWRDLFIRAEQERKRKLERISRTIEMKEKSRGPVRKTQLAFTDTTPKPPRNVKKIQAKAEKGFVKATTIPCSVSAPSSSSSAPAASAPKKTKGLLMKNALKMMQTIRRQY